MIFLCACHSTILDYWTACIPWVLLCFGIFNYVPSLKLTNITSAWHLAFGFHSCQHHLVHDGPRRCPEPPSTIGHPNPDIYRSYLGWGRTSLVKSTSSLAWTQPAPYWMLLWRTWALPSFLDAVNHSIWVTAILLPFWTCQGGLHNFPPVWQSTTIGSRNANRLCAQSTKPSQGNFARYSTSSPCSKKGLCLYCGNPRHFTLSCKMMGSSLKGDPTMSLPVPLLSLCLRAHITWSMTWLFFFTLWQTLST